MPPKKNTITSNNVTLNAQDLSELTAKEQSAVASLTVGLFASNPISHEQAPAAAASAAAAAARPAPIAAQMPSMPVANKDAAPAAAAAAHKTHPKAKRAHHAMNEQGASAAASSQPREQVNQTMPSPVMLQLASLTPITDAMSAAPAKKARYEQPSLNSANSAAAPQGISSSAAAAVSTIPRNAVTYGQYLQPLRVPRPSTPVTESSSSDADSNMSSNASSTSQEEVELQSEQTARLQATQDSIRRHNLYITALNQQLAFLQQQELQQRQMLQQQTLLYAQMQAREFLLAQTERDAALAQQSVEQIERHLLRARKAAHDATITFQHVQNTYGQPSIISVNGNLLDVRSPCNCNESTCLRGAYNRALSSGLLPALLQSLPAAAHFYGPAHLSSAARPAPPVPHINPLIASPAAASAAGAGSVGYLQMPPLLAPNRAGVDRRINPAVSSQQQPLSASMMPSIYLPPSTSASSGQGMATMRNRSLFFSSSNEASQSVLSTHRAAASGPPLQRQAAIDPRLSFAAFLQPPAQGQADASLQIPPPGMGSRGQP